MRLRAPRNDWLIALPTGPTRLASPSSWNQYLSDWDGEMAQAMPYVAAKATNDHTAAIQRRWMRKYKPEMAGVSLMPAANPTPAPPTQLRALASVPIRIAHSTRLIWP